MTERPKGYLLQPGEGTTDVFTRASVASTGGAMTPIASTADGGAGYTNFA